ncbi:MAG: hypothetical protein WC028_23155 [Candidatus Obscuribacterales bacterium]
MNSEIYVAPRPDLQDNWRMAKRRTAALVVDWAISSGIVSIPIMFNLGTLPEFSASFDFMQRLYHAIAKDHVVLYSVALLFTPVPIIYLRLCFRVFMRSGTPGEMLMGLMIDFRRKNSSGWMNEILYGLAQYCYVLCSCVLGTIAFFVATTVLLGFFGQLIYSLGIQFGIVLCYLLWAVCILHSLLLCHFTSSKQTFAVNAEHLLGLEVDFVKPGNHV